MRVFISMVFALFGVMLVAPQPSYAQSSGWYYSWDCKGSSQCAAVMGGGRMSGRYGPFQTKEECETHLNGAGKTATSGCSQSGSGSSSASRAPAQEDRNLSPEQAMAAKVMAGGAVGALVGSYGGPEGAAAGAAIGAVGCLLFC
jgi:hypothetical protein